MKLDIKLFIALCLVILCLNAPSIIAQTLFTFPNWTTATRPGSTSPGAAGFNTQTNLPEYLDNNSVWHSIQSSPPMSISVGSTAVANGINTYCLTNNAGVVGNVACGGITSLAVGSTPITGSYSNGQCLIAAFGILTVGSCGTGGSSNLTIGTTSVVGGTTGQYLFNNGGVLGNQAIPTATNSSLGLVEADGSSLTINSGVLSILSVSNFVAISGGCGNSTGAGAIQVGSINSTLVENFQSGSNYGILTSDCGKVIKLSNASAQTPTIPQANSTGFLTNWYTTACNVGGGTQTITPVGGTIAGLTSYPLGAGSVSAPNCIGIYAGSSVGSSDYGIVTGQSNIFPTTIQQTTAYSAAGTPLPTCNTAAKGSYAWVSDATSPTFHSTYTSGGTVISPVFCNGTNWISI